MLIFPDLNAGNIGYKLVQRFAGYPGRGPHSSGTEQAHSRSVARMLRRGHCESDRRGSPAGTKIGSYGCRITSTDAKPAAGNSCAFSPSATSP
ncbi:MAG: phosphate acyltransferase [Candidatus Marinimicrobia bacterium]|nr:phosphate acyltransferase [Candidatus Neomarinimicrobiota bacterium]